MVELEDLSEHQIYLTFMMFLRYKVQGLRYTLSNFSKSVLGFDFQKVDNFCCKILRYFVFEANQGQLDRAPQE
jgi:hypothetical protein